MEKPHLGNTGKNIFWIVASTLLVALVAYAILSGSVVKKIDIPGVLGVEFAANPEKPNEPQPAGPIEQLRASALEKKISELEKQDLARREADLQRRLAELESRAAEQEQLMPLDDPSLENTVNAMNAANTANRQIAEPNIAGAWHSQDGFSYVFTQVGNNVTMQEINPTLNIVQSVGEGTISGGSMVLQIQTILGIGGILNLSISPDERQLIGTFMDQLTNSPQQIVLIR